MRKNRLLHKFNKTAPISFHKIDLIPRITWKGERRPSHAESKETEALAPPLRASVSRPVRKSIALDGFQCLGCSYTNVTPAEYISALQMTHSENETVEGCPGVHLFILFQQWKKKFEFQVSKQSSGTQKGSIEYPGDVLLSWAPKPGRGWQATVQAFEFQLGPQSVAKSYGNSE